MRRHRISFRGEKFEPFIKVFEVEQRRRRRCVVPLSRSPRGCIPRSLRLRIAAVPPASRMSLESHYYVCSCCVLVGQKSKTLQQPLPTAEYFHTFFFPPPRDEFKVSSDTQGEEFAVCAFLYMFTGTTPPPPNDKRLIGLDTLVSTSAAVTWREI